MVGSLSSKHPSYVSSSPDWVQMRDTYKGQRQVKNKNTLYLPATASHILDGYGGTNPAASGYSSYDSYKKRARYHNFVREAVEMAVGMMHNQPPEIKLPDPMKDIRSSRNESLPNFLRRINYEQLLTGRLGIMADLPKTVGDGPDRPILSAYSAERIINWDTGTTELAMDSLNLIVLDETGQQRQENLSWKEQTQFRVLTLGPIDENNPEGEYKQGIFSNDIFVSTSMKPPSHKGMKLDELPFIIINSVDISSEPDDPILLDLSNLCLTLYRGDADYRQNLFMQGQDTFVTVGGTFDNEDEIRVGAGARIDLPQGGDAKYVGVNSTGLSEQRESISKLESRAGTMGAQTLDSTSRERESGDSMRIRVASRTADLNQVAETGALALEDLLKICAKWMGEDPNEVSVTPNKEFGEMPLTGQTMVEMATARTLGFPISARSLHDLSVKRGITIRSFEEEMKEASAEESEDHPFKTPDTADRAGSEQNTPEE